MFKLSEKLIKRFWSKVDIRSEDECWEWKPPLYGGGYGQFSIKRKRQQAHRIAYFLTYPDADQSLIVRHKVCDNPKCCNPKHLELGTHQDNMNDMYEHNRQRKPLYPEEKPKIMKLSKTQILALLKDYSMSFFTLEQLCDKYSLSYFQLKNILENKNWKWLD